jgi:glycosyltransferase involved in cell wall biosynthesis
VFVGYQVKILMIYNEYRSDRGGEDKVVENMVSLFEKKNIAVRLVRRSSKNLGFLEKCRASVKGIYNIEAYRTVSRLVAKECPDVVHVHNLYPLFSPSVLVACRDAGMPVVMTVHNYGLTCPHWSHYRNGEICELCAKGNVMWCVLKNCQGNILESAGYAVRSGVAMHFNLFQNNVTRFIALTDFSRQWLISAGFSPEKIDVVPNMIDIPGYKGDPGNGLYGAFAGRISPEKGVETLISAAAVLPGVPFSVAGSGPLLERFQQQPVSNVKFRGLLDFCELSEFFSNARFLVVPSRSYEMCPTVILEAMAMGLPIIASRIGGLPEIVQDGQTGLLFEPGNSEDLARKARLLWDNPEFCRKLGLSGREWVIRECREDIHIQRLMSVYDKAMSC